MKSKLFIIMLIAVSFAVIGMLSGCGDNSNNNGQNTDELRDDTIRITYGSGFVIADDGSFEGKYALAIYNDAAKTQMKHLIVSNTTTTGLDTICIYTISNTAFKFWLGCYESDTNLNFTAESSDSSIVSVSLKSSTSYDLASHNTGEATVNITTEDGRKTWVKVIVVDSYGDMPDLD